MTTQPTEQQYLDSALLRLDESLLLWGIDNHLGYRTPEVMRLSVSGATNLVALVNTMNSEIGRLSGIIGELYSEKVTTPRHTKDSL
jgi:hypothetical protein